MYDDCLCKVLNAAVELQGCPKQQQLSPGDDGHDRTMVASGNVCRVVSTEFEWSGNCSSFRLGCLPNALEGVVAVRLDEVGSAGAMCLVEVKKRISNRR
jgi:hypothetical protein